MFWQSTTLVGIQAFMSREMMIMDMVGVRHEIVVDVRVEEIATNVANQDIWHAIAPKVMVVVEVEDRETVIFVDEVVTLLEIVLMEASEVEVVQAVEIASSVENLAI